VERAELVAWEGLAASAGREAPAATAPRNYQPEEVEPAIAHRSYLPAAVIDVSTTRHIAEAPHTKIALRRTGSEVRRAVIR
jgi:hypothetical protein